MVKLYCGALQDNLLWWCITYPSFCKETNLELEVQVPWCQYKTLEVPHNKKTYTLFFERGYVILYNADSLRFSHVLVDHKSLFAPAIPSNMATTQVHVCVLGTNTHVDATITVVYKTGKRQNLVKIQKNVAARLSEMYQTDISADHVTLIVDGRISCA